MNSTHLNYKRFHESYMENHKGSSIWECLIMVSQFPGLIHILLYILDTTNLGKWTVSSFLVEYIMIVAPLVLIYTVLHRYNYSFFFFVLSFSILLTIITYQKRKMYSRKINLCSPPSQNRPCVSYFRSIGNIISVFCILAVDFTIFPRRFAKTESYGFGLMDTGVGIYIVSNGLVTKPKLKEHLVKSFKSSVPLIVLGVLRCISVSVLDYQQHLSEYGAHWNFFFTLAAVKLICPLILARWPNGAFWFSLTLAMMHQMALSSGIEDWIINDPSREDLLSANKEGLISLPGYLSLYLAAVYLGKLIPKQSLNLESDIRTSVKFLALSLVFFVLTHLLLPKFDASRRLINITYITWIISFALITLTLFIIIEISLRVHYSLAGKKEGNMCPTIISAVNYNGLFFFLLANILTGIINLNIETLYVPPLQSILLLNSYMFFLCLMVCLLYKYRIKIAVL